MDVRAVRSKVNIGVFIGLAVMFVLVYALRQALTPFVLAALFAYALDPAVRAMEKRRVRRGFSVALFVTLFFLAMAGVAGFVIYMAQREVGQLIANLPVYMQTVETEWLPVIRRYMGLGDEFNIGYITAQIKDKLTHITPESLSQAGEYALTALSGTFNFFLALLNLVLIPVLMAYMLFDLDSFKEKALSILPREHEREVVVKLGEVERVLLDFLRGQLMVSVIMGVLYSLGLWIVGVDMPFLVGMGSGLLNIVPYLGGTIGIVVSIILAALKFHDLVHPASVVAVFAVVHTLEGYFITPRIVGKKLGLHPLVIMLSLVVFGHLLGFVGVLLAVPTAAVLKVFVAGFIRDYKGTRLYSGAVK